MSKTADQIITAAYVEAKRKTPAPASGTPQYNALLAILDNMQKVWAAEPDIEWNSLYSIVNNGAITATNSFVLDTTIDYIVKRETDPIYTATASTGVTRVNYPLVQPNQLYVNSDINVVAHAGANLLFPRSFVATDTNFGWNIYVPAILKVSDIDAGADVVQVDDPTWLIFMLAADFIRNDVVRQNQYGQLVAYAQEIMRKMKQKNQGQTEEVSTEWSPNGGENL